VSNSRSANDCIPLRSKIAHGTYGDGDEKLVSSARKTDRVSQTVLTSYAFIAARPKSANMLTRDGIEGEFKRRDEITARFRG
jgi:hypothetical protein